MPSSKQSKKPKPAHTAAENREAKRMWNELAALEQIAPERLAAHIELEVNKTERQGPEVLIRQVGAHREYVHPAETPSLDDMLQDLSEERSDNNRGYGHAELWGANQFALKAETEIYNNWVKLQCNRRGLRNPGELTEGMFSERFWNANSGGDK